MIIDQQSIKIKDLFEGYINRDVEGGVTGYNDNLDIRPKYQREFVYGDKQRQEVIKTVLRGFPLNSMYWVDRGAEFDNTDEARFEVLDGQQRTISICQFLDGDFSVDDMYFHNLTKDLQESILNYELLVFVCAGTDSEKLDWFRTINIAGEKLTDQELRNATYAGSWVSDAKRYFSKTSGAVYQVGGDYLKGSAIRQDYLETTLKWVSTNEDVTIEQYMAQHQHDTTAEPLWQYLRDVIDWVQKVFPVKRKKIMKGLPWGIFYNEHHERNDLDPDVLEQQINKLLSDDEVTKKQGVYEYLLTGSERCLSLRSFTPTDKQTAYERQNGVCPICHKHFEFEQMQGDHILPWSKGGHTVVENCQMLCKDCNLRKSDN